ncbi:primosomal replication protein N [Serratia symbiotica str. 'Cinara cedri']|nr:primosomal replication protein N [Serratia symbiotica str. 'Cinara cedri']
MIFNQLVLSGTVCSGLSQKVSPTGIPHCQFLLEHSSQQIEAGLNRHVWCRINVVASGHAMQALIQKLTVGSQVSVQGFISCHQGRVGLSKLFLHASQIKLIDSGD